MVNDIAIKVENLSKAYKLYNAPLDRMKEALHPLKKRYHREFYALNNINFEIKKGECVGILGKNGAGKSTLLKIITGVLTPTSGHVKVNGRIAALLELGAGFNPNYTGIENIYFQGNLMGFNRQQIDSMVEKILNFAEIGDFAHQPVKNYSSGMFARLAFAVSIHVEPDILIVDEALSVGDAAFQNKCIRQMISILEKGVTVLFVSHDIQAINKFCTKAIWLKDGEKYMEGNTETVTNSYMSYSVYGLLPEAPCQIDNLIEQPHLLGKKQLLEQLIPTEGLESFGEDKARILKIGFLDNTGNLTNVLRQGEKAKFVCEMIAFEDLYDVGIGVLLKDRLNTEILTFNSYMYKNPLDFMAKQTKYLTIINFEVPKIFPGEYTVTVALSTGTQLNHNQQHWIHVATTIKIISKDLIDACIVSLYQDEVEYNYEQI
ncbi:ABC transporter ATP-binding protein [Legionella gresilensis]|uniref:ABC transporter ATP-binding protein n=1 Tax=Legionella gresilensis TaxID=91823 RepID=UPI0010412603|nr:ABC transporter ATP-binding protein [Legionella gresilensis]